MLENGKPIVINFDTNEMGRILMNVKVLKGDLLSHKTVRFKLDTGADYTVIARETLKDLGYTDEFLRSCPKDKYPATMADGTKVQLYYIPNVSIMFKEREIQNCRIYFSLDAKMRTLFGCNILKFFNYTVNYDSSEILLQERSTLPKLAEGEQPIQVYEIG
ncbi:MAG: retroviral-like aspartic protease family protein [Firmicutes bacterium]|nr:retroviral-like aspartic protease family protein [Bacillota bacterium]